MLIWIMSNFSQTCYRLVRKNVLYKILSAKSCPSSQFFGQKYQFYGKEKLSFLNKIANDMRYRSKFNKILKINQTFIYLKDLIFEEFYLMKISYFVLSGIFANSFRIKDRLFVTDSV